MMEREREEEAGVSLLTAATEPSYPFSICTYPSPCPLFRSQFTQASLDCCCAAEYLVRGDGEREREEEEGVL